jgi:hypothetical protein
VVAAKPFPALASTADKRLRRLVAALVANPDSEAAVQEFGEWCKQRFPKDPVIRDGKYEVSILSRKSG